MAEREGNGRQQKGADEVARSPVTRVHLNKRGKDDSEATQDLQRGGRRFRFLTEKSGRVGKG